MGGVLQAKMAGHGEENQYQEHDDQRVHFLINPFLKTGWLDLIFPLVSSAFLALA